MADIAIFPDLLRWRASTDPDRVVLTVDGAGSLTLAAWEQRSNSLARGLVARGVQRGDRVAVISDNARWVEYMVAYLGVHKAGAVAVPLAPRFTDAELAHVFANCDPVAVVCPDPLRPAAPPGWTAAVPELEAGQDESTFQVPLDPTDLADILYTSGTTGTPKGVACSHANVTFSVPPEPVPGRERPSVTFLHAFPVGTNAGQEVLRVPLRRGDTSSVTLPRFDPDRFCALIEQHRVMRLQLVPAMAQMILASGAHRRHDVSSIERVTLGSAPSPPALLPQLAQAFPGAEVWNVYTLTEAGAARTLMIFDPTRPGAVGKPVWGSEASVVDGEGNPLPAGEVGEVWLRRAGAPRRFYYRDPDATAAAFSGEWLKTGDLGRLDTDCYLFLVDRKKDVIISGGHNIASVEVEHALYEHPAVIDAAAFGRPHQVLGQDVAAAAVIDGVVSERELQAFLRQRLSEHKIPRRIIFLDELPRNASGKVLKRQLRDRAAEDERGPSPSRPATDLESAMLAIWREVLDLPAVNLDDDFFACGGHSLAAVELAARIDENFEIELPVGAVFEHPTPAELTSTVAQAQADAERQRAGHAPAS